MQTWPAPAFSATTVVDLATLRPGERAGLIVFGGDYAWIGVERGDGPPRIVLRVLENAAQGREEREVAAIDAPRGALTLRVTVGPGGVCTFAAGDGTRMTALATTFTARPGRWVGAKVGLFAAAPADARQTGYVAVRSFEVGR
jgi:hypothetical protein